MFEKILVAFVLAIPLLMFCAALIGYFYLNSVLNSEDNFNRLTINKYVYLDGSLGFELREWYRYRLPGMVVPLLDYHVICRSPSKEKIERAMEHKLEHG